MPARVVSHAELGESGDLAVLSAKRRTKPNLYQLLSTIDSNPLAESRHRHNTAAATGVYQPVMHRDNLAPIDLPDTPTVASTLAHRTVMQAELCSKPPLVWDWVIEHEDRKKEAKADAAIHGAPPFQVDRKLLKDIVHEKMGAEVARIKFLGAGTFHKGYLITLVDIREVVARVARRFMPRLKTESEVATMQYLREHTSIPVPIVHHYDSNPFNRLGGEYIIMSKASGIPLSQVFHSMPHSDLVALTENVALLAIPLFAHRFNGIGSLYLGPDLESVNRASSSPTPTAISGKRQLDLTPLSSQTPDKSQTRVVNPSLDFHVGPIISWPFFGSNRGELAHPNEISRGPWRSTHEYLLSCAEREIQGVILEHEGKSAPHRLHLDPGEIQASRHHHVEALPGDESDMSEEWDWEESEAEWEGPGDTMYRDYRRMQRTTFLVAHLKQREEKVKEEMERFVRMMERLGAVSHEEGDGGGGEEFSLDCHDLSLENVFVDEHDNSKITCIIDWESTTTRPLWACAHVPTFLQSSPFTAKIFRATVEKLTRRSHPIEVNGHMVDLASVTSEWLHYEASGARLRMAHRCIEWDGWEEGLVESILGPEEEEEEWFRSWEEVNAGGDTSVDSVAESSPTSGSPTLAESTSEGEDAQKRTARADEAAKVKLQGRPQVPMVAKVVAVEKEKEKLLNATGDFCGGRGGELGRRLEAWLHVNGDGDGRVGLGRRWEGEDEANAE